MISHAALSSVAIRAGRVPWLTLLESVCFENRYFRPLTIFLFSLPTVIDFALCAMEFFSPREEDAILDLKGLSLPCLPIIHAKVLLIGNTDA